MTDLVIVLQIRRTASVVAGLSFHAIVMDNVAIEIGSVFQLPAR